MKKLILFVALFATLAAAFPQEDPEEFSLGGFPFEDEEFSMTGFPGEEDFSQMGMMEEAAEDLAVTEVEVDLVELQLIQSYRKCKRKCYMFFWSRRRYKNCKRRCRESSSGGEGSPERHGEGSPERGGYGSRDRGGYGSRDRGPYGSRDRGQHGPPRRCLVFE